MLPATKRKPATAKPQIRDETRFDVAILRITDTGERNRAHCDSLSDLGDFGACYLPIDGSWHIAYEWMPRFESGTIVEEVQDFAEDVGRKNAVEDDR